MNPIVRQRLVASAAAGLALAAPFASVTLDAQAKPAASVRKGYQPFRGYPDRFTFEYPTKDWEQIAGGTSSVLTLAQKKREAAVIIEYQPLRLELDLLAKHAELVLVEVCELDRRHSAGIDT